MMKRKNHYNLDNLYLPKDCLIQKPCIITIKLYMYYEKVTYDINQLFHITPPLSACPGVPYVVYGQP